VRETAWLIGLLTTTLRPLRALCEIKRLLRYDF
jgi:hypothetical protein